MSLYGIPFGKKAWRLYDIETHEFFISRDVIFFEDKFPGVKNTAYVTPPALQNTSFDDWLHPITLSRGSTSAPQPTDTRVVSTEHNTTPIIAETISTPTETPPTSPSQAPVVSSTTPPDLCSSSQSSPTDQTLTPPSPPITSPSETTPEQYEPNKSPGLLEVLGRGQRTKKPSILLKNFITHTAATINPSHVQATYDRSSLPTASDNSLYPIADYLSSSVFSAKHQAFLVNLTTEYVPTTFKEAILDERFKGAMKAEVTALEDNHTWDVTTLPPGKKAITCRWLYSNKYKADGTIERPKARLVAHGNRQKEGRDYKDTFAPVAKMNTVRFLLKIAAAKRWEVHQMDVHNEFLH